MTEDISLKKSNLPLRYLFGGLSLVSLSVPMFFLIDSIDRGVESISHLTLVDGEETYSIRSEGDSFMITYDDGKSQYQVPLSAHLTPITLLGPIENLSGSFNQDGLFQPDVTSTLTKEKVTRAGCRIADQLLMTRKSGLPYHQTYRNIMALISRGTNVDPHDLARKKSASIKANLKCE